MPKVFTPIDPSIIALNSILFDIDVANYMQAAVQIAPFTAQALPGAGQIIFEGSNDRLTWGALPYTLSAGTLFTAGTLNLTGNALVTLSLPYRFFRGRLSIAVTSPPASPYITLCLNELVRPASMQDQASPAVSISGSVTLAGSSGVQINASGAATGASAIRLASCAASNNATLVKASSGRVYKIQALNTSAAVKFIKFFNKATAPVPGTDTPIMIFALPPNNQLANIDLGDMGAQMGTGIGYCIVGAAADLDNTPVAAGDVVGVNIVYI